MRRRQEVIYLALHTLRARELYALLGGDNLFPADRNRAIAELSKIVDAALAVEVERRKRQA